jgi:hypothetical protein
MSTPEPTLVATLTDHTQPVVCLAVFHDDSVISGSYDRTLRVRFFFRLCSAVCG